MLTLVTTVTPILTAPSYREILAAKSRAFGSVDKCKWNSKLIRRVFGSLKLTERMRKRAQLGSLKLKKGRYKGFGSVDGCAGPWLANIWQRWALVGRH